MLLLNYLIFKNFNAFSNTLVLHEKFTAECMERCKEKSPFMNVDGSSVNFGVLDHIQSFFSMNTLLLGSVDIPT